MRSMKRRIAAIAATAMIITSMPFNTVDILASEAIPLEEADLSDTAEELMEEAVDDISNENIAVPEAAADTANPDMLLTEEPEIIETAPQMIFSPETDGSDIASGTIGGVNWKIDSNGILTVKGNGNKIKDNNGNVPWLAYKGQITGAEIDLYNVTDLSGMFEDCSNLQTLDFTKFKVTNATNMSNMFKGCSSLSTIDLSTFKPGLVTDMSGMFKDCTALTKIDLNGFGSVTVQNVSEMFSGCTSLAELNASQFDLIRVTDMSNMFKDCSSLPAAELDYANSASLTNISGMFDGCTALAELDLSRMNMENVTATGSMLNGCLSINKIKVPYQIKNNVSIQLPGNPPKWYIKDAENPENIEEITDEIPKGSILINGDIPQPSTVLYSGSYKNIMWWIYEDGSLSVNGTGDIRDDNNKIPWLEHTDVITSARITLSGTQNLSGMLKGCDKIEGNYALDLSKLNTSSATNMSEMFSGCSGITAIDLSGFNTANVTDMSAMFSGCISLISVDISGFSSAALTNVSSMFDGCSSLTAVNMSGFGSGGNVADMNCMFRNCTLLPEIDFSSFDLTDIDGLDKVADMFYGCTSLIKVTAPAVPTYAIDLPGIGWTTGTERVEKIEAGTAAGTVFDKADDIAQGKYGSVIWWIDSAGVLNVKGTGDFRDVGASHTEAPWHTYRSYITGAIINLSGSTDLSMMFDGCSNLTSVSLNNLDTSSCTDMYVMFRGCSKLTSIDLSGFDTSSVTNMNGMFSGCESLASIDVSGFDTSLVTDMRIMFENCKTLTTIDLSEFDLSSVTGSNAFDMLKGCSALGSVISPDKLEVDISLPEVENKGWSKDNTGRASGERAYKIAAYTVKGTVYRTTQNITGIKLYLNGAEITSTIDLDPGTTVRIKAVVSPASSDPWDIQWISGDTSAVTVTPDISSITGNSVEADITAGSKQGTVVVTAKSGSASASVTVRTNQVIKLDRNVMTLLAGQSDALTVTIASGSGYNVNTLVWTSSNIRVATVDSTGNVTASTTVKKQITAEITVTTPDGKYYDKCTVTVKPDPNVIVIDWGDLTDDIKNLFGNDIDNVPKGIWYLMPENGTGSENRVVHTDGGDLDYHVTYNATNRTFDEKIEVFYNVRKLWARRDYRITYRNNKAAAGVNDRKSPLVTIAGTGSFQNNVTFKFNIDPEDINNADLHSEKEVVVDKNTKIGTIKPSLKYKGSKIILNRDYVITYYKDSVAPGNEIDNPKRERADVGTDYYIVIEGKSGGNFTGVMSDPVKIITIDPSDRSMVRLKKAKVRLKSLPWTGEPYMLQDLFDNTLSDNDAVKVTYDGYTLKYGVDFTVDNVSCNDAGKYVFALHGTGSAGTGEKKFYGDKKVSLEIVGIPASKIKFAAFTNNVFYDNGVEITMDHLYKEDSTGYDKVTLYTVKSGRQEILIEGKDYTYEMPNSGATGKFKLKVTLKGEYSGVINKTITVLRYNMYKDTRNKMDVKVEKAKFCKAGARPEVTVTYGNELLREDIDYKLTFKNNNRVGTESNGQSAPRVTVTGIGNYSGDIVEKFDIEQASMDDIELVLDDIEWKKNFGRGQFKSTPWLMNGGKSLKMREDIEYVPKSDFIYRYANTGEIIDDKTKEIAPGTKVEVRVTIECKDGRPFKPGVRELIGYYTIREKSKDLKNATVYIKEPSNLVCADTREEILKLLIDNMEISLKNSSGNKTVLLNGRDYEITDIANYNTAGTATVVIEGRGTYGGKKTQKVKIYRRKQ